jgi:exonuclease III
MSVFKSYVDKISDIVSMYTSKGQVIEMGDFNCHLNSKSLAKENNDKCGYFKDLIDNHYLTAVHTHDVCKGARSSFVSYNGVHESLIDHILIPVNVANTVTKCEILQDSALNVSTHRPIYCNKPPFTIHVYFIAF